MSQDERSFLHDIANSVGAAFVAVDSVFEEIENARDLKDQAVWVERLKEAFKALERSRDLIKSRREALVAQDEKK